MATQTWAPPDELKSTQVLPDFKPFESAGEANDPTTMGIFLCLLDERPHLHPSLQALNAHRTRAHNCPPLDAGQHPSGHGREWTAWRLTEAEEARRAAYLPHV